jgi:hypothetical protein
MPMGSRVYRQVGEWCTSTMCWSSDDVSSADDVFGRQYRPIPSIRHHWGTRNHRDFTEDVFGRGYHPDSAIPHHWGTRTHGDYADDVFKAYRPDAAWPSHYGTHEHHDYVDDVYARKYKPDPVFPYHWGTRKHEDYADDVFSRPFVSWDMPYGVAAPRAGDFVQDISPSENAGDVMKAGAEDKSKSFYGWKGVQETGPGGTFKSWWPPGNRQQDVMGKGGNAVPTVRGDEGPNNYRIPFKDYLGQYASEGHQGPPAIAHFPDMTPPRSWKGSSPALAAAGEHARAGAAAEAAGRSALKDRAKAHLQRKAVAHLLRSAFLKHDAGAAAGEVDIPGTGMVEAGGAQDHQQGRVAGSRGRSPGDAGAGEASAAALAAGKVQSNARRLVGELYNVGYDLQSQGPSPLRI